MADVLRLGASESGGPQHAFLAMPVYAQPSPAATLALAGVERAFRAAGIRYELELLAGNCHVDDARNLLVRDFLESSATDLVFLDADLGWSPADLVRLVQHDRDVVAGVYPRRQDTEDYPCMLPPGEIWSDRDGLIRAERVPTGFLRIRRHVLERLAERAPRYQEKASAARRALIPIIFERTLEGGVRYGGDYAFCNKWRALGGEIFVDPNLRFAHCGARSWIGSYGSFLKRQAGLGLEGLAAVRAGREDGETIERLYEGWDNSWAGSPEFLLATIDLARDARGPILECGSGLSTLVMAAANPGQRIISLEHSPDWAERVRTAAQQHGLTNIRVDVAPLIRYGASRWYDYQALGAAADESEFALLVIDGPPRQLGTRTIVFEALGPQIERAVWLMDDAHDLDQLEPFRIQAEAQGRTVHTLGTLRPFAVAAPKGWAD